MANVINRVKYSELRCVRGFTLDVRYLEEMNYNGEWEPSGYQVFLGQKPIKVFWGYPSEADLETCLPKRNAGA